MNNPIKVIQFGEGNFLRSFADWMITRMNRETSFGGSVVVVQPIEQGRIADLNRQNGCYHIVMKGLQNETPVREIERIDCIEVGINPYTDFDTYLQAAELPELRFVISNTTESGIAFDANCRFTDKPAKSFPGKLVQFLYKRFTHFNGDAAKGLIFLPCELIDRNGDELKKCIVQYARLWQLGNAFEEWIESANLFANTLVDRIVTGYPHESAKEIEAEIGCCDSLISESEIFHLWVIEGNAAIEKEFPAREAGLNVLFVPEMKPYRDRKVTLLNGAHTILAPVAYLYGLNTVREGAENALIGTFLKKVTADELMPSLNLPRGELESFAADVTERFKNPYIHHQLTGIMLNSFSKYKTRDLPSLKSYVARNGKLPSGLVAGLAAICVYYRGGARGNDTIAPNDDQATLSLLQQAWRNSSPNEVANTVLQSQELWGEDLTTIEGLRDMLTDYIERIITQGIEPIINEIVSK